MATPSLEQLFSTFLASGDEQALAQWLRRSAPTLRTAARRLGANADDAEDLVQETLVAAVHGAVRWDATRPLLPWLKGILTFRAAKYARDAARRPARAAGGEPAAVADSLVAATTPVVDDLARRELRDDVHAAIAQLPERYRAPLQQFLFAGHSPVEIAARLGRERATVRVHLHRGLSRLRVLLQRWAGLALLLLFGRPANAGGLVRATRRLALPASLAAMLWLVWPGTNGGSTVAAAAAAVATPIAAPAPGGDPGPRAVVEAGPARRPAAAPGLRLRVRAADGTPLPHVGASLAPAAGRDPVSYRQRQVSDANGELHWPTATAGRVRVVLDRGLCRDFDLDAGPAVHEVTVTTGRTVRGIVREPDGAPCAGAQVWLGQPGDPWRGTDVASTDADGTFTLRHVPVGSFVAARHARFAGTDVQQPGADDTCDLRFSDPGRSTIVRVRDGAGTLLVDALVFVGDAADAAPLWLADGAAPLRPPPFEARTDARGEVRPGGLPAAPQRLAVRQAGMAPWHGWLDAAVPLHEVVLRPGASLTGTVRDANGAPLPGVDVVHRGLQPGSCIDLLSDAQGRFEFDGLAVGGNELAARAPGRVPRAFAVPVLAAGATTTMDVVLARARTVRARAVDGRGRALAGDLRATWPSSQLDPAARVATLDADGCATFADGRDGEPSLAFRPAGEPLWRTVDAYVAWSGDEVVVAPPAEFAADAWLSGRLRTAEGRGLGHARLFVQGDGGPWAEIGRTDGGGAFRLGPLPAGRYVLFAETTDATLPTFVAEAVELTAGTALPLDLLLPPAGRVELQFTLPDGAPPGDLAITIVDRVRHRRCALHTRPQFAQALLPGDYLVYVMGSRIAWQQAIPVRVDAGAVTTLEVPLRAGHRITFAPCSLPSIAGTVARPFTLHGGDGAEVGTWMLPADHSLRLAAVLAPDRYELRHRTADGATFAGELVVPADGGPGAFLVAMRPR